MKGRGETRQSLRSYRLSGLTGLRSICRNSERPKAITIVGILIAHFESNERSFQFRNRRRHHRRRRQRYRDSLLRFTEEGSAPFGSPAASTWRPMTPRDRSAASICKDGRSDGTGIALKSTLSRPLVAIYIWSHPNKLQRSQPPAFQHTVGQLYLSAALTKRPSN